MDIVYFVIALFRVDFSYLSASCRDLAAHGRWRRAIYVIEPEWVKEIVQEDLETYMNNM